MPASVAKSIEAHGDYLMKEQNNHLHNADGENFASLKRCMQDITHQTLPQECLSLLRQPKRMGAQMQRCE